VSRINAWLKHPVASRDAASIKPAEIALYRDQQIKAGKANASIRIELSLLSAVYKCAKHEWGYALLSNPLAEIKRPPPSRGRERRLEDGELDALLAATKDTTLSSLILLAVETAMRAGELLSLRWDNSNIDKRTALLPDTKNGERRIVPLSSKALQILAGLPPPRRTLSIGMMFLSEVLHGT
jgi:integrase